MSDPVVPPVPAPDNKGGDDNSIIKAMREQIEAANRAAKESAEAKVALENRLTELERKDMDEKTRMAAELEDAKKIAAEVETLRNERGQYISTLESLYTSRLSSVSEELRPKVEALSVAGDWSQRMTALESAIGLIQSVTPASPAPARAGTYTQPPGSPPPAQDQPKPLTPQELRATSLRSIVDVRRQTDPAYTVFHPNTKTNS